MNDEEKEKLLLDVIQLRETIIARERLKESVERWVDECSRNGRSAPMWNDYEAACRSVEKLLMKLMGVT